MSDTSTPLHSDLTNALACPTVSLAHRQKGDRMGWTLRDPRPEGIVIYPSRKGGAELRIDVRGESYQLLVYPDHDEQDVTEHLANAYLYLGLVVMEEEPPVYLQDGGVLYWLATESGVPL